MLVAGPTLGLITAAEAAREKPAGTAPPPRLRRALAFEGVTIRFAAGARPALHEVSLRVPALACVAVTGPSGAGKSTLADLAGGLIDADHGTVRVDDAVLSGAARQAWRTRVSYVQQDAMILAASLRDNLLLADGTADDDALQAALAQASAGFVADWPDGLDTRLGDGGRGLSGGERQRVALARALLRKPDLLILDEATSARDAANESAIADAVAALKGRLTILIIGHRGALGALADHRVRLVAGRIAAA